MSLDGALWSESEVEFYEFLFSCIDTNVEMSAFLYVYMSCCIAWGSWICDEYVE
jgi:hypothetical protein